MKRMAGDFRICFISVFIALLLIGCVGKQVDLSKGIGSVFGKNANSVTRHMDIALRSLDKVGEQKEPEPTIERGKTTSKGQTKNEAEAQNGRRKIPGSSGPHVATSTDAAKHQTPQEEFDSMFSGKSAALSNHPSMRQIVSGNTLYRHDLSGIFISAAYYRTDGKMFLMFLPKSDLIKVDWAVNGDEICHIYEHPAQRRCFTLGKDNEGKYGFYQDGRPVERFIRIVEGDPKNLETAYLANADYYDEQARKNASAAAGGALILKALEIESQQQAQLCRDDPAAYRRRYCRGARSPSECPC